MVHVTTEVDGAEELALRFGMAHEMFALEDYRAMERSVHIAERWIKEQTPRRSGRLFSSWKSEVQVSPLGGVIGRVATNVKYGPFVERDTVPHIIRARNAGALMIPIHPLAGSFGYMGSIFGGGRLAGNVARSGQQVIFRNNVRHPGTRGKHMAYYGLLYAKPFIRDEFNEAARRVMRMIAHAGISGGGIYPIR